MKRIFFIANGVFGGHIAGGDIHFWEMARALIRQGFEVHLLGGKILQNHLQQWRLPLQLHFTEDEPVTNLSDETLSGQIKLFQIYVKRCWKSLEILQQEAQTEDVIYAVSDFWFDVWPMVKCRAKFKVGVWHMQCPGLREIIFRQRADVSWVRLPSLHYWLSQSLALRWIKKCPYKKIFYLHPSMKQPLLKLGYNENEISPISYGVDVVTAQKVEEVKKEYDVIWLGRVHRQKGIDDIIPALKYLAERVPNFKAVVVGKIKEYLLPLLSQELVDKVFFPGFVSEEEKFRLLKASRVFLMPSRHEGSPRVMAEALLCGNRVVAYEVETYPGVFHDWIQYVTKFDLALFQKEIERQIIQSRANERVINSFDLNRFEKENAWEATGNHFVTEIKKLIHES
ncbi:MAG: glycosyltransferase family 4 protein [Verrucomicrobiae bacterium]|nr:glycosyltransferase family 4 protein [Verrucomicrobiae bacterium]